MAKRKKTTPAVPDYAEEDRDGLPPFFRQQVSEARQRAGFWKRLGVRSSEEVVLGVPLPSLAEQYFYGNTVLALGRMLLLVGESDSCKSAYDFHLMTRFAQGVGGVTYYLYTEGRDTPDLRTSIMEKWAPYCWPIKCPSLEDWQQQITFKLNDFDAQYGDKRTDPDEPLNCDFAAQFVVDSVAGTTSKSIQDKIREVGYAEATFGVDAARISLYAKHIFNRLASGPFFLTATNHVKYRSDRYGNPQMVIPGGDALKYHSTYVVRARKVQDIQDRKSVEGGRRIELYTIKNSLGERSRSVTVEFWWTYDERGVQHSVWDWDAAGVELLQKSTARGWDAAREVVPLEKVNQSMRTAACPALDLPKSVPYSVLGRKIAETPEVMEKLQKIFHIHVRRPFVNKVPYHQQLEDAVRAGSVHRAEEQDGSEGEAAEGVPGE